MRDVITSTRNETVRAVAKLKRGRERSRTGSILVEGPNVFGDLLAAGLEPQLVLVTEEDDVSLARLERLPSVEVHVVSRNVLESVADAAHPRSPIAVMARPEPSQIRAHNVVILVGLADPGNAGTIVRTAAAFGWDVGYTPDCVDLWSPKTIRAGAGSHFRTRLVAIDLEPDIASLSGHTIVATVVIGGNTGVDAPGPYALLVGSEPHGLEPGQVALASHLLTIDMVDSTESLNVSVASGITMHLLR